MPPLFQVFRKRYRLWCLISYTFSHLILAMILLLTRSYSWGDWIMEFAQYHASASGKKDSNSVSLIVETSSLPHTLGLGRILHAKASLEFSGLCGHLRGCMQGNDTVWENCPWKDRVAWRPKEVCSPSLWITACVTFQYCFSKASWPRDRHQEAIPVSGPDLKSFKPFYLTTLPLAFISATLLTEILYWK